MDDIRHGWKVLTHDFCSPFQGGAPIWEGIPVVTTPTVALDTGPADCAAGWNYCSELATAFRIVGLWPTGRPSVAVAVIASADAIERRDKRRASSLTLVRLATAEEIHGATRRLSKPFGPHADAITVEQLAWRSALARPRSDPAAVRAGLTGALEARGLPWTLREFPTARVARAARDAWEARVAWEAREAWEALSLWYAARMEWIHRPADLLTTGLRDAYAAGLEIAIPTGPDELGYALAEEE